VTRHADGLTLSAQARRARRRRRRRGGSRVPATRPDRR
jgi:hypothetical protein